MRLFFVGRLGVDRVRTVLQERADEARELAAVLEQTAGRQRGRRSRHHADLEMRLRLATLANGLAHARAELDWAQDLLAELTD